MENVYTVEDAFGSLTGRLAEATGWKYLKSQRCLKARLDDLVFEILFFSSKWNRSGESVEVKAEFRLVYRKYGPLAIDNVVAQISYEPHPKEGKQPYWFDISNSEKLNEVYTDLNQRIQHTAVALYHDYEKDFKSATEKMFRQHCDDYHVNLRFVADTLGVDTIREKAQQLYDALPENQKQWIAAYLKGERSFPGIRNQASMKYIIDQHLIKEE